MKHLYALITAVGIEFSPVAYARDHHMLEQCSVADCTDGFCGADQTDDEYDVGFDYGPTPSDKRSYNDPGYASGEWPDGH